MLMADHNEFGKIAEDLAVDFLIKNQYKILARNFRYLKAEVDIIAEKENQIVIVEVKARNTDAFLEPQEAVNKKKIKLLISASNYFIEENNIDKEVRFDIISVLPNKQKTLEIHHIIDAFQSFEI
ncbi:YraN family protein [Epilithonimonas zeae]|nr:YraN family protein [Epilithonimonas zeae]